MLLLYQISKRQYVIGTGYPSGEGVPVRPLYDTSFTWTGLKLRSNQGLAGPEVRRGLVLDGSIVEVVVGGFWAL
jgi:hypothetical protein